MSKSIYERALESAKQHHEVTDMSLEIKALEQAQKQEKLLEIYKELTTVKEDMLSCCEVYEDEYYDIEEMATDLKLQIWELENDEQN